MLGGNLNVRYTTDFGVSNAVVIGVECSDGTSSNLVKIGILTWTGDYTQTGVNGSLYIKIRNDSPICLIKR